MTGCIYVETSHIQIFMQTLTVYADFAKGFPVCTVHKKRLYSCFPVSHSGGLQKNIFALFHRQHIGRLLKYDGLCRFNYFLRFFTTIQEYKN